MRKTLRFLFGFLLFFITFGLYTTNRLMYMRTKDPLLVVDREQTAGRYNPDEFNRIPKREVIITSPYGYHLKTVVLEPHHTNKYVIICHGVTENKVNSVKYMNLFIERGFNAVIYDHRRHGESGGNTTSYGHYEKFDLKAVVDWLKADQGPNLLLGIHGESMGAATMLLYAGMLEDGADFYIADCPFSDFKEQLAYRLKQDLKLPGKWVVPVADLFLRMRDRYSLQNIAPITVIDSIKNPILFIHSKKDDFILPTMTEALYEKKTGPKKLFLAENGVHAQSLNENRENYEQALDEFLHDFVFSPLLNRE